MRLNKALAVLVTVILLLLVTTSTAPARAVKSQPSVSQSQIQPVAPVSISESAQRFDVAPPDGVFLGRFEVSRTVDADPIELSLARFRPTNAGSSKAIGHTEPPFENYESVANSTDRKPPRPSRI